MLEENLYKILDNLTDGVYVVDNNRRITYWNEAAEKISGYTKDNVISYCCSDGILIHVGEKGEGHCNTNCPFVVAMGNGQVYECKAYLQHKDGHRVYVKIKVLPRYNDKNEIIGAIQIFTDIGGGKLMRERIYELEKLALVDTLTALSNRRHVEIELHNLFHEKLRNNFSFGVIFIDVDDFKKYNDNFGHDIGDRVLKIIANSIKTAARPFDIFGRWGGDEFICIIKNINSKDLIKIAERLRMLVKVSRLSIKDKNLDMSVSLGVTMCNPDDTLESLIERADSLMYKSKSEGKNLVSHDLSI